MDELRKLADEVEGSALRVRPASSITPRQAEWLWQDRVPMAALTLLVGRQGLGKSTLSIHLAARVSRGQLGRPPADVLIASAEDAPEYTIVPRLIAAGADMDRVNIIDIESDGVVASIEIPTDLDRVAEAIDSHNAEFVIVDPVSAHLAQHVDSHKDHSVRTALGPVSRLALATGAAIVGIGHLNKGGGGYVLDRVGGSVGFTAAARSVLLFAADPNSDEDSPDRVLAHAKSNMSELAVPLRYRVEGYVTDSGLKTSRVIEVGEAASVVASDLLREDPEERRLTDDAAEVILDVLANGEVNPSGLAGGSIP
jgi:RecA-family ATPase